MRDVIDPVNTFKDLIESWWKIVAIAVIGGLVGFGFSFLISPTYQAEATFHASIDFTEINYENMVGEYGDPLVWTQYEEDLALQAVERVLLTRMKSAFDYAQTLDPTLDIEKFKDDKQIQRYLAKWFLRFRHEDPKVAQSIVNYWAEDGWQALLNAQEAGDIESFVIVDLISLADQPATPIYHNRNTVVFAGTMAGIFIGILLVDLSSRYLNKRHGEA